MKCEPASSIIQKLGGVSAVAEMAEVTPTTVIRWRMTKAKGGTGGVIPHWHQSKLIERAAQRGLDLAPIHFFGVAA